MRITRLRLENFRNHEDSVLVIGDAAFVVVQGKNFAGKSSIGQALSMCLTPSTTGLDARGWGYQSKIRRGQTKAVITADIQGKQHLIQRTVTLNTNSVGRTQRSVCINQPDWSPTSFDRQLEGKRDVLTVVLNSDAFLRMDEKEQKNLLAGLALPKRYDFDRQIVKSVEMVLGKGEVNFEGEPFMVIQKAYKALFDERQIINRQVREFIVPDPLPVPVGVDSMTLQEQLTTLRVTRQTREAERRQAAQSAATLNGEREHRKAKAQVLGEAIESEEQRAVTIQAFLLPEDKLAEFRGAAAGRAELEGLLQEKEQIESVLDDHLRQGGRLEEMPEAGTECPTCGLFIDPDRIATMAVKLAGQIREAKDKNQLIYEKLKALNGVREAVAEIEKYESAMKELKDIRARVTERRRLLDEAENAVPEPVLFDFSPYEQSIAECDAEIERLSTALRPVIAAEERRKEIVVRQEQLGRLKHKAATLDALVKYFDKDGIKAKLLGEYIGGFENKLNEVLSAWGYTCGLSIEPYQFDVTNTRGDVVPVRELSGAERVMFSLAFQCAVSRTANLGLVVIDEVATLLPELRPAMNKRLYEMIERGYLEQIVLLIADASEQVPAIPGSVLFMVDGGVVHESRGNVLAV